MAERSKIEWTDHTFNPWMGCTRVSAGCQHCYAEQLMDTRWGKVEWGPEGERKRTSKAYWRKPVRWNKVNWCECDGCGWRGKWDDLPYSHNALRCPVCSLKTPSPARQRVFCASLADVFEDREELRPWRRDLLRLIEDTPNLDWLILTKRPENVNRMIWEDTKFRDWLGQHPNVWIGTSAEDQATYERRMTDLMTIPDATRFLSLEPLLGPIDMKIGNLHSAPADCPTWFDWCNCQPNWVIAGGESGPGARPMHPDWVRSIRDQCQQAGVPFLFKQWGAYCAPSQMPSDTYRAWDAKHGTENCWDNDDPRWRVGKKRAGRLLDGRKWHQFPKPEMEPTP